MTWLLSYHLSVFRFLIVDSHIFMPIGGKLQEVKNSINTVYEKAREAISMGLNRMTLTTKAIQRIGSHKMAMIKKLRTAQEDEVIS